MLFAECVGARSGMRPGDVTVENEVSGLARPANNTGLKLKTLGPDTWACFKSSEQFSQG